MPDYETDIQKILSATVKPRNVTRSELSELMQADASLGTRISTSKDLRNLAAYACAIGQSNKQIAEQIGVTPSTVASWRRDPAFQLRVRQIQEKIGMKAVNKRIELIVPKAIAIAEEIMESADVKPETRANVAFRFLEHFKGKPSQPIQTDGNLLREVINRFETEQTKDLNEALDKLLANKTSQSDD